MFDVNVTYCHVMNIVMYCLEIEIASRLLLENLGDVHVNVCTDANAPIDLCICDEYSKLCRPMCSWCWGQELTVVFRADVHL